MECCGEEEGGGGGGCFFGTARGCTLCSGVDCRDETDVPAEADVFGYNLGKHKRNPGPHSCRRQTPGPVGALPPAVNMKRTAGVLEIAVAISLSMCASVLQLQKG